MIYASTLFLEYFCCPPPKKKTPLDISIKKLGQNSIAINFNH